MDLVKKISVPRLRISVTGESRYTRGMEQVAQPFLALVAGAAIGIAFVDAGRALKRAKAYMAARRRA